MSIGITKAITNLNEAHSRLGLSPSGDARFFTEWKAPLPELTATQQNHLDRLKQRYLSYADSGAITKGTVNLILLSPLLETLGFMAAAPTATSFALITNGEDYLFIKLDRPTGHYGLSDKFTLITAEGNGLYPVAQILKRLAAMA
jgi:hypothetical protein